MNTRMDNERIITGGTGYASLWTMLAALLFCALTVNAMKFPPQPAPFRLEGRLNCPVIGSGGGTAYLQVTVTAPAAVSRTVRTPMNLSVVIDRSGSMGDQRKMEYAKKAFATLIDQLRPEDVLSVVVYDDEVTLLRSAAKLGNGKQHARRILEEVQPRGSTNLGGGLQKGLQEAERFAGRGYISRVVLLSDGLANVGITDPGQLTMMVRAGRSRSIAVTAMGVGLDYNENLMLALAESGGGNYYFIEHPNMLASMVREELAIVPTVLAQNASLRL
ncbi:MAG: VWA domain-containing protein, partial [Bacteroidetes bacterium]|nr:VWA domain-containing protein [Bacteroidota bacterium]